MKNYGIEFFRVFMCLWVVLFHYTTRYNALFHHQGEWPIYFDLGGRAAVAFFFLVSGFFVGKKIFLVDKMTVKQAFQWFCQKLFRLMPAYIACVSLTFLFLHIWFLPERSSITFTTLLINLVFPLHPGIPYVDSAHWYLSALVLAFAGIALFMNLGFHKKYLWIFLIVLYFFNLYDTSLVHKINSIFFIKRLSPFIAGIFLAFYREKKESKYLVYSLVTMPLLIEQFGNIICLMSIFGGVFLITSNKIAQILNRNIFFLKIGSLGTICYTWYLLHQNIGYLIIYHLEKNEFYSEFLLIIPVLCTLTLSFLVNKFIEPHIKIFFDFLARRFSI